MTPRERVLMAFAHRETDRIPIDFCGHLSSGIAAMLYPGLRARLGLAQKPVRIHDMSQQLAIVHEDVLDLFGVDTIELGRGFSLGDEDWEDWVMPDGTPCQIPVWCRPEREPGRWVLRSDTGRVVSHMPDGSLYFTLAYYSLAASGPGDFSEAREKGLWRAYANPPGPLPEGEEGRRILREGAAALRKNTDRAILGVFGGSLMEGGQSYYGNERFLLDLALEPGKVHGFLNWLVESHLKKLDDYLNCVGPFIDIIVFGDDLGMQKGPQISLAMFREFFKPRYKLLWERAALAGVKVMLHTCGGVREFLPDLIDAGLDAINPVQIAARGMNPAELKKEFGRDLVFWGGGCDTQQVLPFGTPGDVERHVRELMKIWKKDGGYVFQQVHNIQANIPPENVIAMFRSVKEFID